MDFLLIWDRVKNQTDIKTFTKLASFVGTTQQHVSKKKKENVFPVEWAFKIAQKYHLNTDWLMTGKVSENPKRTNEIFENSILHEIDMWLTGLIKEEPFRKEWFIGTFFDAFPTFAKWKKRKDKEESKDTSIQNKAA